MIHVFNPSAPQSTYQWNWVTLIGADSKDFLHRLTTAHVQALHIGEGTKGCFLNPQGKIRALFTLWNFAPGDYAFEFEAGAGAKWKNELLAAIDQYTFAEKITLADISSLECRWIFTDSNSKDEEKSLLARLEAPALQPLHTLAVDEEIRLCHQGSIDFDRTWITAWGRPARLAQWIERVLPPDAGDTQAIGVETLEQWRIENLRPRIDAEITSNTIPLEVGLLDAIAKDKGCYPGQEVIERIISLGAPARRLALLEGIGPTPAVGEGIFNLGEPPAEVGQVTSVIKSDNTPNGFKALGFVRKIHAKEGLQVQLMKSGSQASVIRVTPYD